MTNMAADEDVLRLFHYFLWADEMRACFRRGEPMNPASAATTGNGVKWQHYLYTWLGALYAVVEGWKELHLADPVIDVWLKKKTGRRTEDRGKTVEEYFADHVLKRARHKAFHFERSPHPNAMRDFFASKPGAHRWADSLHDHLDAYFIRRYRGCR